MMPATPTPTLPTLLDELAEHGWKAWAGDYGHTESVLGELRRIADLLGTRSSGRTAVTEEVIQPQSTVDARPRSLSAQFGLDALPLHVELSHRARPCRYLLLGCLDPGTSSATTTLLDWRQLSFSAAELGLLRDSPILVRTGRRSFYSTILASDGTFLRYDPCCLEAIDERGSAALELMQRRIGAALLAVHRWCLGDILVVDNWSVLHGRAPAEPGSGRRLARILVDA
jgi:hypothetical protein